MEDRFNVVNNLEHTDTSIYGIFDGHGGEVIAQSKATGMVVNTKGFCLNY